MVSSSPPTHFSQACYGKQELCRQQIPRSHERAARDFSSNVFIYVLTMSALKREQMANMCLRLVS